MWAVKLCSNKIPQMFLTEGVGWSKLSCIMAIKLVVVRCSSSYGLYGRCCLQCFDAVGWAAGRASGLWKLSGEVLAWLSVWSEVQMICIWSSWCHCHPIISCSSKIDNGLPFWCRLTHVVLEKRPLNGRSSSSCWWCVCVWSVCRENEQRWLMMRVWSCVPHNASDHLSIKPSRHLS